MFIETYKAAGIPLSNAFGVDYPRWFSHPMEEYRALTTNVALIDLTHYGILKLRGSDRAGFLNAMVTNDVARLDAGVASHGAVTGVKGKLIAELYVLAGESDLTVVVSQGDTMRVHEILDKHIIADDVTIEDVSQTAGVLSVEGTNARPLVWRLFPDAPLPMDDLTFIDADYQGMDVRILRNSASGERGFQLIVGIEHIERIRDYLVQAGRGMDMELCGLMAWNMRRIENGLPWFGPDVTEENFPKEARLDDVVSYTKGCFVGQETLARMHHRGHPNWLLVGMTPPEIEPRGETSPPESFDLSDRFPAGSKLYVPDDRAKPAGRTTSVAYSPALEKPLLLGYVRVKTSGIGTKLALETDGDTGIVEIVSLPLEGEKK